MRESASRARIAAPPTWSATVSYRAARAKGNHHGVLLAIARISGKPRR